jgi:hypothetical protein
MSSPVRRMRIVAIVISPGAGKPYLGFRGVRSVRRHGSKPTEVGGRLQSGQPSANLPNLPS